MGCRSADLAFCADPAAVPAVAGAYVLAIRIDRPVTVRTARHPRATLAADIYLYCGSARGPGGLKARLGRHMKRTKSLRWHVDQLTTQGTIVGAWIAPGGDECRLVERFADLEAPIPGFGSSDCKRCRSHLLAAQVLKPDGAQRQ